MAEESDGEQEETRSDWQGGRHAERATVMMGFSDMGAPWEGWGQGPLEPCPTGHPCWLC